MANEVDPMIITPQNQFHNLIEPHDVITVTLMRSGRGISIYTVTQKDIYILSRIDQVRLFSLFTIIFGWLDYLLLSCTNAFHVLLSCSNAIPERSFFRDVIGAIGHQISYPLQPVSLNLRETLSNYVVANSIECDWGAAMQAAIQDVQGVIANGFENVTSQVKSLSLQQSKGHDVISNKVDVLTDKVSQLCDHFLSTLSESWKPSIAMNCSCIYNAHLPIVSVTSQPVISSVLRTCRHPSAVAEFANFVQVLQFGCSNSTNVCNVWIYPYFRNIQECVTTLGKRTGIENLVFVFDAKASVYLDPTATGLTIFALYSRHELLDPMYRQGFISLPRFDYSNTSFGKLVYRLCDIAINADKLISTLTHEISTWMVDLMQRVKLPWSLVAQQHYNAILNSEGLFVKKVLLSADEISLLHELVNKFRVSKHRDAIERALWKFSKQIRSEIVFPCLMASDKRKYHAGIHHVRGNIVSVPCGIEVDIGHALFHPCCAPSHAKHVDLSFSDQKLSLTRFGRRTFCPVCFHELPGLPFALLCQINCLFYRKVQINHLPDVASISDLQLVPKPIRIIEYDVLKVNGVHVPPLVTLGREIQSEDDDQ